MPLIWNLKNKINEKTKTTKKDIHNVGHAMYVEKRCKLGENTN